MGITTALMLTAGNAVLGAVGAYGQGQATASSDAYAAAVAKNNATIAANNARYEGQAGAAEELTQGLKNRAQTGAIKTAQAGNGINVNTGSAVGVQASQAEFGQYEGLQIRANTARKAYGYNVQSSDYMAQSQLETAAAKNAREAGAIGAASSLLGGVASGLSEWQTYKLSAPGANGIDTSSLGSSAFGPAPSGFPGSSSYWDAASGLVSNPTHL